MSSDRNSIYIVPIEPIDQRYTKQWFENIPRILEDATSMEIISVAGCGVQDKTTPGAFLDFACTNIYKASQVEYISEMFYCKTIKPGDRFLFTDAWHFGVIAVKYMSELLDIPVELHGIWHAGAYDPTDILGMKMDLAWAQPFEESLYYALDYNYFATQFHLNMFCGNRGVSSYKAIRSGQPHNPIIKPLLEMSTAEKYPYIMFPHRLNSDKQPEIAEDLGEKFSILTTQKLNLTKTQYYQKLSHAKAIFSCALHENLGISVMEGCLAGAIPIVPDRASYAEMYLHEFTYPSAWTSSWDNYLKHKDQLVSYIQDKLDNYDRYYGSLMLQRNILIDKYLIPTEMVNRLTR